MRAAPLIPIALLAACSVSKEPDPAASASAHATVLAPEPSTPVPSPATVAARSVSEKTEAYEFIYAYPAAAAAHPALKNLLDTDLDKARAELILDAKEGQLDAKNNGYPYNAHSHTVDWQVVSDLPAWLSLSSLIGFYSGGAHPNYVFDTILWDKTANARRAPADLFMSKAALFAAIRDPFCKELDKQRAKKRDGQSLGGGISEFEECIDPVEQTVILGSANNKVFDRIGVLVAPYGAGPYVEGSYEVTIPVTSKVLAAVKPEYKVAFTNP